MTRTVRRPAADAHKKAVVIEINEIARYLQELLGQKLVAYMAGVSDPKVVGRWAQGTQPPRDEPDRRLRTVLKICHLLLSQDNTHAVRAWFIGMNPQLGDDSPAEAMHDGRLKEALATAMSFMSGG